MCADAREEEGKEDADILREWASLAKARAFMKLEYGRCDRWMFSCDELARDREHLFEIGCKYCKPWARMALDITIGALPALAIEANNTRGEAATMVREWAKNKASLKL